MMISPAITLWRGLHRNSFVFNRWMLTLFITIYGSVIFMAELTDGYGHRQSVYDHYVGLPFEQFVTELSNILTFQSNENLQIQSDVYIHVLSYFVAEVILMPGLFFVFVSFIYGYFFSGSVLKVLRYIPPFKEAKLLYGFIVVFLLWKSVEGINTVRTWTGLWILFYAAISFLETRKPKYFLLLFVPPFVHLGYFVMVLPVFAVLLAGPRPLIYSILFTMSFTTTLFNQQSMISQLEQTEVGQEKVRNYYVEEPTENRTGWSSEELKDKTWYTRLQRSGISGWGVNMLAFSMILLGLYSMDRMTNVEINLFSMGLLMKVLSNSTWFLFALSNRSGLIAGLFILGAFVMMFARFQPFSWRERFFARILAPISFLLLTPFIVYKMADLIQFTSVFVLFFPFIAWIDSGLNISIRGALEYLL